MRTLDRTITDRGSKYAVSGAPCRSPEEARKLVRSLRKATKFARATHNSWGLICDGNRSKSDDGEAGAGLTILNILERENVTDHLIVVTRWYGGKPLGGNRFRHVQDAVRLYLDDLKRDSGRGSD